MNHGHFPEEFSRTPKPPFNIVDSEIMTEIQKPQYVESGRQIFVLPSQLNSAEYPSYTHVVKQLSEYISDNTGGPRGQLACAPEIAQFIIDNAACEGHEDRVLNNVAETIKGNEDRITLHNGYLGVSRSASFSDVERFKANIHKTTLLASCDIRADGLTPEKLGFALNSKTVDLLYASAVPYQTYNNLHTDTVLNEKVCKLVLYAQYAAAFCWAAERSPCELFVMPLGGGVFQNPWDWIYDALCRAFAYAKSVADLSGVKVNILTWSGNSAEKNTLEKIMRHYHAD